MVERSESSVDIFVEFNIRVFVVELSRSFVFFSFVDRFL